MVTFDQLNAVL